MKRILLILLLLLLAVGAWVFVSGMDETARIRAAAERGDPDAQMRYASMLLDDRGTREGGKPNTLAGIAWLRKAAESGNNRARFALALMHIAGDRVSKDHEAAGRLFIDMAEDGSTAAQTVVGDMFERGWTVPESTDMAMRFYRQAAKGGSAHARIRLSRMLKDGQVPRVRFDEIATLSRDPSEIGELATLFQIAMTQRYLASPESDGGAAEKERSAVLDSMAIFSGLTRPAAKEAGFDLSLIGDAQMQIFLSDVERLAWQIVLERHDPLTEKGRTNRLSVTMPADRVAIAEALADRTTEKWEKDK